MILRNIKTKSAGVKLRSGRQLYVTFVRRREKLEKFEIIEQEKRICETPYERLKRMWHELFFSQSNEEDLSPSDQEYLDDFLDMPYFYVY